MTDTIIDLLRHGEPRGGRAFRGHGIDDPLSETGWAQMWACLGPQVPWQKIISSPMLRCSEFAESLGEKHRIPVYIEDRFKEVGFGLWEGCTPEQIKVKNPVQYQAFYADPVNQRPPGAEPLSQFIARVSTAFEELLSRHLGEHLLLVSHAGVMRAIIAHILQADAVGLYKIKVNYAGLSRIRCGKYGAVLEGLNVTNLSNFT